MAKKHISGSFIAAAITIATGITADEGATNEFVSEVVDVQGIEKIAVQIETTSEASSTGTVTAYFAASPTDTPAWDTFKSTAQPFASANFDPTTNASERHTAIIEVHGIHSLKLIAIHNGTNKEIDVNVHYGKNVLIL